MSSHSVSIFPPSFFITPACSRRDLHIFSICSWKEAGVSVVMRRKCRMPSKVIFCAVLGSAFPPFIRHLRR
ncbi:MAG: hypothetical protein H5T72_00900 [Actinobacteria bacterium]|nr:hypothetical protein [Actinomycetota bacterium]